MNIKTAYPYDTRIQEARTRTPTPVLVREGAMRGDENAARPQLKTSSWLSITRKVVRFDRRRHDGTRAQSGMDYRGCGRID